LAHAGPAFQFGRNQGGFRTICVQVEHKQIDASLHKAEDTFMAVAGADGSPPVILEQSAAKIQIDKVIPNAQHAPGNPLPHCPSSWARDSTQTPISRKLGAFSSRIPPSRSEQDHTLGLRACIVCPTTLDMGNLLSEFQDIPLRWKTSNVTR
jgi:hypothetical protein